MSYFHGKFRSFFYYEIVEIIFENRKLCQQLELGNPLINHRMYYQLGKLIYSHL